MKEGSGFGRRSLLVVGAGVLLFGVACGGGGAAPAQPSVGAAPAGAQGDAKKGEKLYVEKGCVACHGEKAVGNPAIGAPKTAGTQLTFDEVLKQVRTPRQTMAPFTPQQVSDAEVRDIYAYLKSLK